MGESKLDWTDEMTAIKSALNKFKYDLYMDYRIDELPDVSGIRVVVKGVKINGRFTKFNKDICIALWHLKMVGHTLKEAYAEIMIKSELDMENPTFEPEPIKEEKYV